MVAGSAGTAGAAEGACVQTLQHVKHAQGPYHTRTLQQLQCSHTSSNYRDHSAPSHRTEVTTKQATGIQTSRMLQQGVVMLDVFQQRQQ